MDKNRNPFENYQPLQGDEGKKDKLYKKMVHLNKYGNLPEQPQRHFMKYLTPAVVLTLFFIMIPFLVNNEETTLDKPKEEEKKPTAEITKRDDWYYGEGANWKGYINIKSAEAWVDGKVKDHSAWSESNGELTFKGPIPGAIKQVKYAVELEHGGTGGTVTYNTAFSGKVNIMSGGGNSITHAEEAIKVTVEWNGKKEVIPFIHDRNNSMTEKIERAKAVSTVVPFLENDEQFRPPQFLVAGEDNFQLGASTWDPLIAQMDNINPSLNQWNESQNVLLMFKNLTTITDELTIKGKHESGTEEILYKAPIYQNAVESYKDYDWVIPANLSFKKNGIWTLTAFEGDKKVGKVTIDVQRTGASFMATPMSEDGKVRGLKVGIKSAIEEIDGEPTIFLGDTYGQKVLWKFFGPWPDEVIIQGIHESGTASFTDVLDDIKKTDQDRVYEAVDGVTLKKEGIWNFRFYSNEEYLGEITLNAQKYK